MTMRMLIDARHREETRVAVVKGNRIEEFDFESAEHKQIKGNIYLAKVTRVEPSLQAAFVDYGGNRHGFLAFSEIHPDYYQIPKEDREALMREEAEHAAEEERLRAREDEDEENDAADDIADADREVAVDPRDDLGGDTDDDFEVDGDDDTPPVPPAESIAGGDDSADQLRSQRMNLRRRYKIQDVVHRRQVLLVQVVKEERGNKGAALTTYLSLAGRYCVLMPNTTHGGGISRKISNVADRKRLKSIMAELDLPKTMGCIVRTAGLQRTKTEIKRDFDYLARVWDQIREQTLKSSAPAEIHGDSDLIKRAIRDIYNRDIDEVIVEGEHGFRAAREFMKMLMPSHAKRVVPYADAVPLYQRYGVEDQLNAMYQPVVQLKSGGYLVINPTEALVSIDINSGRSTREHGIEQTAVGTNLEAAQEIARQLRLRDMAGLVVIDFIDMEHGSNVRKVEKAMKTALAGDRARIQVGRISSFGLMEMSRQRLRTGVLEASTRTCPHCEGTGLVRTASSAALSGLRLIEDEAARGAGNRITLRASQEAAVYLLNRKRGELGEIEERYGVIIEVFPDGETEGARMAAEVSGPPPAYRPRIEPIAFIETDLDDDVIDEEDEESDADAREGARDDDDRGEAKGDDSGDGKRKRSRRRRGRRGRREDGSDEPETREAAEQSADQHADQSGEQVSDDAEDDAPEASGGETGDGTARRRNRRGRRGGRNRRGEETASTTADNGTHAGDVTADTVAVADVDANGAPEAVAAVAAETVDAAQDEASVKKARRRPAARKAVATVAKGSSADIAVVVPQMAVPATAAISADEATPALDSAPVKPKRTRKPKAEAATDSPADARGDVLADAPGDAPGDAPAEVPADVPPEKPKRKSRAKAVAATSEAPSANEAASAAVEPAPVAAMPQSAAPTPAMSQSAVSEPASLEAGAQVETPRRGWWQRTFGGED